MFKNYNLKRPVYKIWKYSGEVALPEEVASVLRGKANSVRVITTQDLLPVRYLEIVVGNKRHTVLPDEYIILYDRLMGEIEVRDNIRDFEPMNI